MLVNFTIPPMDLGPSLNLLKNGLVVDPITPAIGSIALGSTTRPFLGITRTLNTTNLQPVTLSMTTPLPIGLRYTHVCGAPGVGSLYYLPHKASPFGHNARNMKPLFVLRKNALQLLNNFITYLTLAGAKSHRLWTIWNISMSSSKSKPSCRISLSLMSPRYLSFRAYPFHTKNNSSAGSFTPSTLIVMNFTKFTNPMTLSCPRAAPLQLLRPLLARLLPPILSAKAPDFLFPYPIQDLCL